MSATILAFPARAASTPHLPIPCDPTTARMARHILERIGGFEPATTADVIAHLADLNWEEHEITRHLHAAWKVARSMRGAPA